MSADAVVADRAQERWAWIEVIELDEHLGLRAVDLAVAHGLRSLAAIHLSAALSAPVDQLTVATWDRRLHAAVAEGVATLPQSPP